MQPDPVETKRAWQRFVEQGELAPDVLREHICRAWRRCEQFHVDPLAGAARRLTLSETTALLARSHGLIEAADPYLRALSLAAGNERHAAMLGDDAGVVLDIVADEETARDTPGFPTPGSLLSESVAGANGIGTALAEGRYVELVGPEHFIEGFHVYTCQGVPIRGVDGEVVGVLSVSVRRTEAAEHLHEILICAAHGISELVRRRLEADMAEVLQHSLVEGSNLDALRQDVTQLQAAARLRLEHAARVTRTRATGAFDILSIAQRLLQRFRARSRTWRDIAFGQVGMAQPIELQSRLEEIADLVATEAAIRGRHASVEHGEPVMILADPREVSRLLFRWFLHALDAAAAGEVAQARIEIMEQAGRARISFTPAVKETLEFPLASTLH